MRILTLEPYHGGSHKAFLDGWTHQSSHPWTVLGLPAYKWKWRMRHAAITLADQVSLLVEAGHEWDLLFCSDMLNLAEFLGLAPERVRQLPSVVYFHENQLTYPVRHESERDYHFVLTNLTTALAATRVWFNSGFHRDSFLDALPGFLKRMPDYQPLDAILRIREKATIQPPGIEAFLPRGLRPPGPLRILWAARWEHDKNPETFFDALTLLKSRGIDFRVSVVGEQFREMPPAFETARQTFGERIDRWGYQQSRQDYESALTEADVIVSTAHHEFFGISVVEAIAAGAYPLLPNRLAYPEILAAVNGGDTNAFLYDGSKEQLAKRLTELADQVDTAAFQNEARNLATRVITRFSWPRLAPELDAALNVICNQRRLD